MFIPDTDICYCSSFLFFFKEFIFDRAESSSLHGLFSSCSNWGLLFVAVLGLVIAVASRVVDHRFRDAQAQYLQLPGSGGQAQQLWSAGSVPPVHMGSSQIRDRTLVSCIGRRILYHWVTRETPSLLLNPLLRRSWNSLEVGTGSSSSLQKILKSDSFLGRVAKGPSYFRFIHSLIQPTTYCKSGPLLDREMKEVAPASQSSQPS